MLEIRGLRVEYGPVEAVRGVDLDVGASELVALLGPNGAGKTSVLRAISQLISHEGTVTFDGENIEGQLPDNVARRGLIHVPEGRRIFGTLNVHENLQMGTTARHGRPATYSLDDIYDLFPALAPLRKRAAYVLSGGEQQMVAIGRALAAAPRLLLLDEPSLGLAPLIAATVFKALEAASTTTPILLVEQDTALALRISHRAYVLTLGRVAVAGLADELQNREALLSAYLGRSPGA
jgi:branched-chain amino acid transport system ATP-binding protein